MMEDRKVLLALHETKGLGWKSITKIAACCPNLSDLVDQPAPIWRDMGFAAEQADRISEALTKSVIADRLAELVSGNIEFITPFDLAYPEPLKEIAQPPWVLYFKGRASLLNRRCLAVVGTRTPTIYGRRVAHSLAEGLSNAGVCVVSGMARGIDSDAHRGALKSSGRTIAVMAAGIDKVYPAENRPLYDEIVREGLVVTEMPPGTPPAPGLFPLRNRIIAGLSMGTIVVEAARKSGSLITAEQALEESRDVFAVPGPVTSPKSSGTHELIKQGAKLVASADDILEDYRHLIGVDNRSPATRETPGSRPAEALSEVERQVLRHLSGEPVSFDQLLAVTKLPFGLLHSVLLSLCLKKRITQVPGSSYVRIS